MYGNKQHNFLVSDDDGINVNGDGSIENDIILNIDDVKIQEHIVSSDDEENVCADEQNSFMLFFCTFLICR